MDSLCYVSASRSTLAVRCTQSRTGSHPRPTLTPFRRCRARFAQTAANHSTASSASEYTFSNRVLSSPLRIKIAPVGGKTPRRLISHKNGASRRSYASPSADETGGHSASRSSFPSIPEKPRTQPTKGKLFTQRIPRRACFRCDTAPPRLDIKRGRKKNRLNSLNSRIPWTRICCAGEQTHLN